MKRRGLFILLVAAGLVAADPPRQSTVTADAGKMPGVGGQPLEQEVASLRARVKSLEQRLAALEAVLAKNPGVDAKPLGKVGQIFIVGNTKTADTVILGQLPFVSAGAFSQADLDLAVRRLELLNIFVVDPVKGIRPQVTVVDPMSKGPFHDIMVRVQEK